MLSALNSGASTPGSSPGCHGVVFLGKTLCLHGACLHPVVSMSTHKFITGGIEYSLHATESGISSNMMS